MATMVSGAGRKFAGRCPWAIISGVRRHLSRRELVDHLFPDFRMLIKVLADELIKSQTSGFGGRIVATETMDLHELSNDLKVVSMKRCCTERKRPSRDEIG